MAKESKKALVPKLRFPEFARQALSEVRLSDVTAESSIRNGDGVPAGRVMGVSKVLGIVPMEERIVASDIARYKLVRKDWFAYNPKRLNIGSIARWHGDADILVSPDYVVFQCGDDPNSGIEPSYLDHFRQSTAWDAFVSEGGDGGVRVRIYYKDIARLELALPQRAEQQKIADCLSSLDELIAAQGRKVEALKTYKRGLMQQLFPREGETLPRLRFPEFRDAPDWEEKQIGSLFDLEKKAEKATGFDRDRVITVKLHAKGVVKNDRTGTLSGGSNYFKRRFGEFIFSKIDLLNGAFGIVPSELDGFLSSSDVPSFSFTHDASPKFFLVWLTAHYDRLVLERNGTSPTLKRVAPEKFFSLKINLPCPVEQKKIAGCLLSLDSEVAAESEMLNVLKIHKKGLMQQIFPSLEGA